MKKSVSKEMRPAPDSPAERMDSKSFVSRELWVDLTRSYRETLNTALNLCSNIETVVKRVELGRIHVGDALLRIEELCTVTKCSDFLDDDGFLNQVLGVTSQTPQDQSSPADESQDLSPDDLTPRRRVH